jgi:hypothetical protein
MVNHVGKGKGKAVDPIDVDDNGSLGGDGDDEEDNWDDLLNYVAPEQSRPSSLGGIKASKCLIFRRCVH